MKTIWNILAALAFFASIYFFSFGYDKMNNYYNGEDHSSLNHNVYVGGDAYNYIINANYSTGFFVLGMASSMSGIGFLILGYLDHIVTNQKIQFEILEKNKLGNKPEDFEDIPEL
jgi:hypothetical protein